MDFATCNVIYVDRGVGEDKLVRRGSIKSNANGLHLGSDGLSDDREQVCLNVKTLLRTFNEVHVCQSGTACVAKLAELADASAENLIPTLVLVNIPHDDHLDESKPARTPSPLTRSLTDLGPDEVDGAFYGLDLLRWIVLDIQQRNLSKLVVPVAVAAASMDQQTSTDSGCESATDETADCEGERRRTSDAAQILLEPRRTMKYIDLGAVDVLSSPIPEDRLPSLAIHAYRAHKESLKDRNAFLEVKRGRKRSWVGLDDEKPYAYLREAMVSGLMDGICRVGASDDAPVKQARLSIALQRRERIQDSIGTWYFSAHDFTDDELLHAAQLMLQHALEIPELSQWRISTENLTSFLLACRAAYNAFVPYHNFRHVIDVLQAVFCFLIKIGTLPPYPSNDSAVESPSKSPIAKLLRPFDALTLLITAIGHDVGHPGVNNAFLVTLNAPLAQLYNDRSVLESFHCAAYSQILRRYWPAAFSHMEMRQLMISSILATDMGLHFDYMKKLGFMQEKLHENGGTDGFNGRLLEEYRALACAVLIKCADISNVARRYDVAAQWTMILTDEFARQALMETELGIPSALFAPPVREIIELGKSQVSFMNMFAIPLFAGVTDVMPAMQFAVDELNKNVSIWDGRVKEEQELRKQQKVNEDPRHHQMDGMFSPRAMSLAIPATGIGSGSDEMLKQGDSPVLSGSSSGAMAKLTNHIHAKLGQSNLRSMSNLDEISESDTPNGSLEPVTEKDLVQERNGVESEPLIPPFYSTETRSRNSTPDQLQLSFATVSAPGLLEKSGGHSLVTDAVVREPQDTATTMPRPETAGTTEGSHSLPGTSTTATTAHTAAKTGPPLSPSIQRTSFVSNGSLGGGAGSTEPDHLSRSAPAVASHVLSQPTVPSDYKSATASHLTKTTSGTSSADKERGRQPGSAGGGGGGGNMVEKMRTLARKSSRGRFRMSFWKKGSKGEAPPVPSSIVGRGNASFDERA